MVGVYIVGGLYGRGLYGRGLYGRGPYGRGLYVRGLYVKTTKNCNKIVIVIIFFSVFYAGAFKRIKGLLIVFFQTICKMSLSLGLLF